MLRTGFRFPVTSARTAHRWSPRTCFLLSERAGGFDELPGWFAAQFPDPVAAVTEWDGYLSGQYVCLRAVTPQNMKRKDELVAAIESHLENAQVHRPGWLVSLHGLIDELAELEPPFAPYDRLRFGGPVSRERLIDVTRERYPRRLPGTTVPNQGANSQPARARTHVR
jgi:hypothetical protein